MVQGERFVTHVPNPTNQQHPNTDNRFQTMAVPVNHSDKNVPADVRIVEISREPVELYKILKFEGMVASGGQAKVAVAAGQVLVNGKIEIQKRKKIVSGDTIEFNNEKIAIRLASNATNEVSPAQTAAENSVAIDVEKK